LRQNWSQSLAASRLRAMQKWSLRMIADKAVELAYIDSISHVSVAKVKKNELILKKKWNAKQDKICKSGIKPDLCIMKIEFNSRKTKISLS
jgi:hypothetical protein